MTHRYAIEKWPGGDVPDGAELRRRMEADGYSFYRWSDQPGTIYGAHVHGDNQSHWVLSGRLELVVTGFGTVVLEAGDRDFMPAGTEHSARVLGDEPVVYLIGSKT